MTMEGSVRIEVVEGQVAPRPAVAGDVKTIYLTDRQWTVFVFLAESIVDRGRRPSYDDIASKCDYADKTGARTGVRALVRLGLATTHVREARSIALTPEGESFFRSWAAAGRKKVKPKKRKP